MKTPSIPCFTGWKVRNFELYISKKMNTIQMIIKFNYLVLSIVLQNDIKLRSSELDQTMCVIDWTYHSQHQPLLAGLWNHCPARPEVRWATQGTLKSHLRLDIHKNDITVDNHSDTQNNNLLIMTSSGHYLFIIFGDIQTLNKLKRPNLSQVRKISNDWTRNQDL